MAKEKSSSLEKLEYKPISLKGLIAITIFVAILIWSYVGSEGNFPLLFSGEGLSYMFKMVDNMFPPDLSTETLTFLIEPALVTLQISILGTVFAILLGLPFALLATRNFLFGIDVKEVKFGFRYVVYVAARTILSFFRAVPELVWALLFITAVGLGPFPGVLALTIHNAGIIGKIYSEFLESVDPGSLEALQATGANRIQMFLYGMQPQALPNLVSYTLFRWECNIRQATILGFVGAGGIGFYVLLAARMLQYDQLLTTILIIFILVVGVDNLSAYIRKRIITT